MKTTPHTFVIDEIGTEAEQICISVVMDEPKEGYYGGKVCGPVFREIAERCASYLNLPPDPKLMTNAPPMIAENISGKVPNQ